MSEYLHPFISNVDAVDIIKEKILSRTPFAFTRFGDGEIHIFNRNGYPAFEQKNLREWGYKYPDEIEKFYDEANEILIRAFSNSDLIGLMDKNCNIINLNYRPEHWSLTKGMVESWGINVDNLKICDHMLSRQKIFGSPEGFKNVVQKEPFHIITPYVKRMQERNLDQIFETSITYTLHSETVNFNNRETILKEFEKIEPQVVLMGIGLQKDYGIYLRDNFGKIVLDMGATMDAWAGIESRHWFGVGNKQDYLMIRK